MRIIRESKNVSAVRTHEGDLIVRVRKKHCPRIFPHSIMPDCPECNELYQEKLLLVVDTWDTAKLYFSPPEMVPLKRRVSFAVTRFFNWIGSCLSK